MLDAHETPIQCLEYCEERDELATCGMGNKVHIWDISRPSVIKRKLVLDHSDGEVRETASMHNTAQHSTEQHYLCIY